MDFKSANRKINITALVSVLGIPAFYLAAYSNELIRYNQHFFMPWLFPGNLGLPIIIIVVLLSIAVFNKSRTGAIVLIAFYIITKAISYLFFIAIDEWFDTVWQLIFLFFFLLWAYIFYQGVVGTYAYHKLKNQEDKS